MMMTFAFCNVDDLTWGTKGLTSDSQNDKAKMTKISFVSEWLLWNTALITFLMICFRTFSWSPKIILVIGVI
jgi:chitin synthase